MEAITVRINGEDRPLPGDLSLDRMLDALDLPKQRVAVEVNNAVVKRSDWERIVIRDRDRIEVVHFVGGG